ncbi:hypothetical protein OUZ56_017215 [Daphnia magna]|uniref:Uncharacterized protein n=1 Tax=Daphnia magna TaxID=35525 RepID=A0ABR0ASF7_9CRUS|nr:hypothetical protein OUZ56_017215 [Daphnia magna]
MLLVSTSKKITQYFVESEDNVKSFSYQQSFFMFNKPSTKNGSSLYVCQVKDCPRMWKTLSTINNFRGNLRTHIKTAHKEKLEEFNILCKEIDATKLMGVQPLRDHSNKKNETGRNPALVQQVLSFRVIAKLLEAVYEEYDILHKLRAMVTNNGSNFVKEFRLYGASSLPSTIERSTSTQNAPPRAASLDVETASTSRTTLHQEPDRSNRMVVGEDNIAALLEDDFSDFEETDDKIKSLSDRNRGNKKEDQGESTTEQESEFEIQEILMLT